MHIVFRYLKFIGLAILISIFLLSFASPPARAVMITTELVIHQDSEWLSDRVQVRTFLKRADVMAQMQAYGLGHEETLSRVDSLTDDEIASIAGKIDQLPVGAYSLDGGILTFIGMALYAIVAAIVIYFSSTPENEEKP